MEWSQQGRVAGPLGSVAAPSRPPGAGLGDFQVAPWVAGFRAGVGLAPNPSSALVASGHSQGLHRFSPLCLP